MDEEWRAIPGYKGIYEVSSAGRVRTVDRYDRAGRFRSSQMRVPQPGLKRGGYPLLNLTDAQGVLKSKKVHQLVALAFLGPPPGRIGSRRDEWQINHKNGIRTDARAENLEWCHPIDNMRHSYVTGIRDGSSRGIKNGRARLTENDIREIRALYAAGGWTAKALGERFGVGHSTIWLITQGVTWSHVK